MVLGGTDSNVYIYKNLKGNESDWNKNQNLSESCQVVSFTNPNEERYYELNSDYGKSSVEHDINASLNDYHMRWKMNYPLNETYTISFKCETPQGIRYMEYSNLYTEGTNNEVYNNDNSDTIECGFSSKYSSGEWNTVDRDPQADLASVEPGNMITKIDSVTYSGGGLITLPDFVGLNAI